MRRALGTAAALLVALLALAPLSRAETWHSETPVAAGVNVPAPLGPVGDIAFEAPDRGVLITQGNAALPAGVYAYDGTGWHLYSTVCGGHEGRIAWAGPDEFWTISDYATRGEGAIPEREFFARTLCHFKDGAVVGSYAAPVGSPEAFLPMDAAACEGPDDCWFAGGRLPGNPNLGAFHLHWDGQSLSAVPSLVTAQPTLADPARAVADLAFHEGLPYESVQVQSDDDVPAEEDHQQPAFLHRVNAFAPASPFEPIFLEGLEYGSGEASELGGFHLAGDGSRFEALAGALGPGIEPALLRDGPGGFEQVELDDPANVLAPGDGVAAFALEPGTTSAWASVTAGFGLQRATLARIEDDGTVAETVTLPSAEEGLNPKGAAGPIACPAPGQCWMATSEGWLFHLGGSPGIDTDPAMHQLITFRPQDASSRSAPPAGLPEDNSGSEVERSRFAEAIPVERFPHRRPKPRPLVFGLKQKVVHRTVLQLSFNLRAEAHVQLLAKVGKKVVAKTALLTLAKGHHKLRLRLDPKHWPTKLAFHVHPVGKKK